MCATVDSQCLEYLMIKMGEVFDINQQIVFLLANGQLNSEWIYEVIVSPKMQTKNYKDFCPIIWNSGLSAGLESGGASIIWWA